MPGGRPSKYDPIKEKLEKIKKLAAHGFIDEEIADFLGIAPSTYYDWKKKHPEFSDTIKRGKAEADSDVIESLFKRANGFEYIEEHLEYVPGSGEAKTTVKQVKKIRKYYPPEVTAIIFWLKNRRRKDWKNINDYDKPGSEEVPKVPEFDNMSDEELKNFIEKETTNADE